MKQLQLPEPIRCMCSEHEEILSRLESLRLTARAGQAGNAGLADLAGRLLSVLDVHLYKEENLLFPPLRTALGNRADALQILEVEHSQVTELRAALASLTEGPGSDNSSDYRGRITEFASAAVEMIRPHIFKEDHVLYPLAASIIPAEDIKHIEVEIDTGNIPTVREPGKHTRNIPQI